MAACGAGLAEDGFAEGIEGGHDAGAYFGVVAAVEVPFALGVGEGSKRPALVDATAAGLGVDPTGGLGPGALLTQLGQGRPTSSFQQVVLGGGVGHRRVGDGRRLLGRQLAPAGSGRRLGQGLEAAGGFDGGCGLDDGCSRPPRQLVRRRPLALRPPRANFGQPRRGQTLEVGRDLLDPRRLLDDLLGLGRRQHGRVEPGGVSAQRLPQLRDPHTHSRAYRPKTKRPTKGEVETATTELVFVSYLPDDPRCNGGSRNGDCPAATTPARCHPRRRQPFSPSPLYGPHGEAGDETFEEGVEDEGDGNRDQDRGRLERLPEEHVASHQLSRHAHRDGLLARP